MVRILESTIIFWYVKNMAQTQNCYAINFKAGFPIDFLKEAAQYNG